MHGRKSTPSPRRGAPISVPAERPAQKTNEPVRRPTLPLPSFISAQPDGVTLAIKLQPRAARNEIGEPIGNELRAQVTAPPVDSAANEALLRLLAETLDCPRSKLELIRGHTSRHKVIRVYGVTARQILNRL